MKSQKDLIATSPIEQDVNHAEERVENKRNKQNKRNKTKQNETKRNKTKQTKQNETNETKRKQTKQTKQTNRCSCKPYDNDSYLGEVLCRHIKRLEARREQAPPGAPAYTCIFPCLHPSLLHILLEKTGRNW